MRALLLILAAAVSLCAQISSPIVAGSGGAFTLTATTASPSQTVTIDRLTLNGSAILNWGDTQTTTITSGSTGTWTHTYASAGTYTIKLPNARMIVGLDLRDAKLGALNTAQLRTSAITYFYVTAITASTIKSADMVAWRPATWELFSMPTGTYSIASADMTAWRPTIWELYSIPTGTYSIASADMVAWRPTRWYLFSMPTGTYSIASADMAAWRPTYWYLVSMPTGTYSIASADMTAWTGITTWQLYSMPNGTYSIASADMTAWTGITTLKYYSMPAVITVAAGSLSPQVAMTTLDLHSNALSAATVNQVLADLVASIAGRGGVKCTTTLNGTNAAPTGQGIIDKATLVTAGWTVSTN